VLAVNVLFLRLSWLKFIIKLQIVGKLSQMLRVVRFCNMAVANGSVCRNVHLSTFDVAYTQKLQLYIGYKHIITSIQWQQ
jgi:hypothetical protein